MNIAMIEQLREAVDLLQDPNRYVYVFPWPRFQASVMYTNLLSTLSQFLRYLYTQYGLSTNH